MPARGRPSLYTQDIADAICERLADGESLRAICRDEGMPQESTVRLWALEDREGFSAQYTKARDIGLDAMADELLEIADDGSNDWMQRNYGEQEAWVANGEAMGRSRLRLDTRKWLMSKMAAKRYGDKLLHTGADGDGAITVEIVRFGTNPTAE